MKTQKNDRDVDETRHMYIKQYNKNADRGQVLDESIKRICIKW